MTEFKFACPVCGQHMAASSGSSGTLIECPTCFQKVIVPEAPHADSKYILSATQYIKPATPASPHANPSAKSKRRPSIVAMISVLILIIAAVVAVMLWPERTFQTRAGTTTNAMKITWSLDLAHAAFPAGTASGQLRGIDFFCDRATLQGRTLTLRQDVVGKPDSSVAVSISLRTTGELAGKSISVKTNDLGAARVTVRWRNSHQVTETFVTGYAMNVTFGEATATQIPGKIYLCLPDEARSRVAGTFNAEVRRSAPSPRPREQ